VFLHFYFFLSNFLSQYTLKNIPILLTINTTHIPTNHNYICCSHLTNTNNFTHSMHSTYCKTAYQRFCSRRRESQLRFSTSPLPNVRRLWQSSTE
jgi:hypothetical protein